MRQKETQCAKILALLKGRAPGWVELWEIMDLRPRIALHTTRIFDLRRAGHRIENETWIVDGVKHSKYRWVPPKAPELKPEVTASPPGLFSPKELRQSWQFGHEDLT